MKKLIEKYGDILSYLFFGVLTTVVNYLVYLPLHEWVRWSATLSNAVAWVFSVAFAYLTNKPFVFKSNDWSKETVIPELAKFVTARISSGLIETVILLVTVDIMALDGGVMKLVTSVLVVVLNYVGSKLLVFRK